VEYLAIHGLSKRYSGVTALDGVDLEFKEGEIHSIIGENGAGKSTLLKILAGIVHAGSGSILFRGEEITGMSPNQLFARGLSASFQETSLFDNLTVTENLFIGQLYDHRGLRISWNAAKAHARTLLEGFGVPSIDPAARVESLSAESRQILEILKTVKPTTRVLSLDEPTASLTKQGVRLLFALIRSLKEKGVTVLYVSHHLDEVLELSDRITVLRDGRKVGELGRAEATEERLHELMIGRSISRSRGPAEGRTFDDGSPLLSVRDLADGKKVRGVSFDVLRGEILGITGLVGAGRTELAQMIFGLAETTAGRITFNDIDITHSLTQEIIRRGIYYLPEERHRLGLFLDQNLMVNTTISRLRRIARGTMLDYRSERSKSEETLSQVGVRYASSRQAVRSLSGGNQQKVLLAKCLFAEPALLILDEPTKGIDVGSKEDIYGLIRILVGQGMTVIVISSEVEEICLLSDRVLVMGDGKVIGTFTRGEINEKSIALCYLQAGAA
jgi:ABC-type sugar transport system ATPase subunit